MRAHNASKKRKGSVYTKAAHVEENSVTDLITTDNGARFIGAYSSSWNEKELVFGACKLTDVTVVVKYGIIKDILCGRAELLVAKSYVPAPSNLKLVKLT